MATRKILVTGAAGFIGYHLCQRLLADGDTVIGLDNLNPYYDVTLKRARLEALQSHDRFTHAEISLEDRTAVARIFTEKSFDIVVNLAAQAGVRYSIEHPEAYIDANLVGFSHILEGCRHSEGTRLVFASSSSVYGANKSLPFSEDQSVDHPVSLYAATKKANELMAHSYSSLYGLPCVGLRFFTVYGPWGRPDMALFLFTKAILAGEPIDVFNKGDMGRDFTYIDDIVEGVVRVMSRPPVPDPGWDATNPNPGSSYAPYRIYNIGANRAENLMRAIEVLEEILGKKATKNFLPMQPGDVANTAADISSIQTDFGFDPCTSIEIGIPKFVDWYRSYYGV